ncbi:MAG TPA: YggT family protein [Candidatus Acidoferrales bacterium]|nr:YggT family protein [Candidatus Acidoferrales bacterium]
MFLLANFVEAVAGVLNMILWIYMWIVIIQALVSWVNADPDNPIVRFLDSATEPVLYRVRRALPFLRASVIDFSPLVVLIAIFFLQTFLVQSLYDVARTLRYGG